METAQHSLKIALCSTDRFAQLVLSTSPYTQQPISTVCHAILFAMVVTQTPDIVLAA